MKLYQINLKEEQDGNTVNKKSLVIDVDKITHIIYNRDSRVRKTDLFDEDWQRVEIMLQGEKRCICFSGADAEIEKLVKAFGLHLVKVVDLKEAIFR